MIDEILTDIEKCDLVNPRVAVVKTLEAVHARLRERRAMTNAERARAITMDEAETRDGACKEIRAFQAEIERILAKVKGVDFLSVLRSGGSEVT